MSKADHAKLKKSIDRLNDMAGAMDAIIIAQNKMGVLVMTLLQTMIKKGLITETEVEMAVAANEQLALDDEGGCKISLTSLLHTGDEDESKGS